MSTAVKYFWRIFFIGLGSFILFLVLCNFGLFGKMPSIDDIQNPTASLSSQLYAQDGTLMGKYYLQDRINVEYKDISPNIIKALVATEDVRYYSHSGIDAKALLRALKGFGSSGGASTITMQTAKNLFTENWSTKNFLLRGIQKIKESIIAVKLERNFTKDEILALYLNTVAFGDNVFGIRNAAKTFFQKEPDRVTVDEAAVLVGMINAPTLYNPRRNPKLALDRRNLVYQRMLTNNTLTKEALDTLKQKPIVLNYKKLDESAGLAPYFRMIVGEELKKWCKTHKKANGELYDVYTDGLKIYTSINPKMQIYAEEAVAKHMSYMQKILNNQANIKNGEVWKGYENVIEAAIKQSERWRANKVAKMDDAKNRAQFDIPVRMKVFAWNSKRELDTVMTPADSVKYNRQMMQAGFMVMDPITGEVRAWVGGVDFKTYKYDHVNINTKRQVGSTMKPLLYSLAIDEAGFTPNSTVMDVQQSFGSYGMVPATSKSCSGGAMSMARALAGSKNCATAYILKQLDNTGNNAAKRFVDFLKNKCYLQTKINPHPSIAIGSCEISLYEMMQAYSMFPGRGFNTKPIFITRIEDRNGNTLENFVPERHEVISDVTAYSVIKMMQGVVEHGTARNLKLSYSITGEIAGKTGTTNENSDAWFIGYTPQLLAGAWVGNDDRFIHISKNDLNGQGGRAAMPIWAYFYEKILNDPNVFGVDPTTVFAKPEVMTNDITMDFIDGNDPTLGAEGDDTGNGSAQDFVPNDIKPEDIAPESQYMPSNEEKENKPAATKEPEKESKKPEPKSTTPATAPATSDKPKTPKAVMPKKS